MTTTAPTTPAPRDVRRATRDTQHPIIGGVAAGLARHLAVPVLWVRAAFLVAAVLGGIGIMFYAGLWLVLPGRVALRGGGARARERRPPGPSPGPDPPAGRLRVRRSPWSRSASAWC